MLFGFILSLLIIQKPLNIFGGIQLDTNTLLYAGAFIIVGFQAFIFGIFTRAYAVQAGFLPSNDKLIKWLEIINLEKGLIGGLIVLFAGLAGTIYSLTLWTEVHFGRLDYPSILRIVIPSVVAIILGLQTMLSSFFISVLNVNKK
jgi:hypothetical protein